MTIYVDTREKPHAIRGILAEFEQKGVTVIHQKMDEGDYKTAPDALFTIDRKQSLSEVCSNLSWEKGRFQRELARAKAKGEKLCVLVENCGEIHTPADVAAWVNPRLKESPKALNGAQLYKLMLVYTARYGVECVSAMRSIQAGRSSDFWQSIWRMNEQQEKGKCRRTGTVRHIGGGWCGTQKRPALCWRCR